MKAWLEKPKGLYIGGRWRPGGAGAFPDFNPATEEKLCDIPAASESDVAEAVAAGRRAFEAGTWSGLSCFDRAAVLRKLADLVDEHRENLAVLETLDTGKPIRESREGDILRAATNLRFFADQAAQAVEAEVFRSQGDEHVARREPLGVVALITPWNLPLYLETWKIAPALLMGNSVVLKPSELTPLTATYFTELVEQAGLPPGVFNLVQGFGENAAGEFLTRHPGVDAISFTGETGTGRAIMKAAAVGPTRVSFELGGKGAAVLFEDADLDKAVAECLRGGFRNQGEICLATPRVFVHGSLYDRFLEKFVAGARALVVGDPLDPNTTMGALISREHWEKVTGYVAQVKDPGKILTGGKRPPGREKGHFLEPTVVVGLGPEHPVSREEIFGPVVSVYPFEREEEVVDRVNDTPYGLSASIWTRSRDRAERVARALRHGLLWVNCWFVRDLRVPFGGQKRSGVGREGGRHSLDFYSEWKSVCYRGGGT